MVNTDSSNPDPFRAFLKNHKIGIAGLKRIMGVSHHTAKKAIQNPHEYINLTQMLKIAGVTGRPLVEIISKILGVHTKPPYRWYISQKEKLIAELDHFGQILE